MIQRTSLRILSSAVLLALLVTAVRPQPAFADEGTPPPDEPAAEATPAPQTSEADPAEAPPASPPEEAEAAAGDVAADALAVPPDASPAEEEVVEALAAETPVEVTGEAAPDALPADLLADLPEGTALAVVNAAGEAVPLVSDEAAEIAATGDPMWCPDGVVPDSPTCSPYYASMSALLGWLDANDPAVDGVIWIEQGAAPDASAVILSQADFPIMSQYRLTLRGGWDAGIGSTITDPEDPSVFNVPIEILDWQNDVTLSDIEVTGVVGGSWALHVTQADGSPGDISLTRVHVHHNTATYGARLDNSIGSSSGVVSVTSSEFSDGTGNGLYVTSDGAITLQDVVAIGNTGGFGASLVNNTAATAAKVTLTTGEFSDNSTYGLFVSSHGAITLREVIAESNDGGYGAFVRNDGATSPVAVSLTSSAFNGNDTFGLQVLSRGGITLNAVEAIKNAGGNGADLDNHGGTGAITITSSEFTANFDGGLAAWSHGAITATDLTAVGNTALGDGYDGVDLFNAYTGVTAGITLTGINIFTDNDASGLVVTSNGAVKLANVLANANDDRGLYVNNTPSDRAQPVTLSGSSTFKYNGGTGVAIDSDGKVSLSNIIANANGDAGAAIDNTTGTADVVLTGASTFNGNNTYGLYIRSAGAIKASNLTANDDGALAGFGNGAYLNNTGAASARAVTLTGVNVFLRDPGGLRIESNGAISISNLTASDASGVGAELTNTAASAQKITLSGTNAFEGNYDSGLVVRSYGAITINNLRGSANGLPADHGYGADIDNTSPGTPQPVKLTGVSLASGNNNDGILIVSKGAISVASLTATDNGAGTASGRGAWLRNNVADAAGAVSLTGTNLFSGNDGIGLYVQSVGAIQVSSTTAADNVENGILLQNTFAPTASPQNVTLTGTTRIEDNELTGLRVESYGTITIASVIANHNGLGHGVEYGVDLANHTGTLARGVTISASATVHGNAWDGLLVHSLGTIKVSKLTASENGHQGAYLDNDSIGAAGGVTLTGFATLLDNNQAGLLVESRGAIAAANLTGSGNGTGGVNGPGAQLDNDAATSPASVKITGTNVFTGNLYDGLWVSSLGAISVSDLSSTGSTLGRGALLDNTVAGTGTPTPTSPGVTLTGTASFNNNHDDGLRIDSYGAISLKTTFLEALDNDGIASADGAHLDNDGAHPDSPRGVTLAGTNVLLRNGFSNLTVYSRGPILVSNLHADGTHNANGVNLYNNADPTVPSAVTLTGTSQINANHWGGLAINSFGPITISSLTASGNLDGAGAVVGNDLAAMPQSIKITGTNVFDDNAGVGLSVESDGAISASNLAVRRNGGSIGAYLTTKAASITLTGTNVFSDNEGMGLDISSEGAISLNNVSADRNGQVALSGNGARISNSSAAPGQPVKLTGTNSFSGNYDSGLAVFSDGAITINNLTANSNTNERGVFLRNNTGTGSITLTGANAFVGNGMEGLYIETTGAVSLSKVSADDNTGDGVYIAGAAGVTLTCGSMTHNGGWGLYVTDWSGLLKLIGVVASGNTAGDIFPDPATSWTVVRACP